MRPDDPTDPHTWLLRAKSNLKLAEKSSHLEGILLEDLCFNAQQSAEKALKAVCLHHNLEFPKTHSLIHLIDILETGGMTLPQEIRAADVLTQYAVEARYPGSDKGRISPGTGTCSCCCLLGGIGHRLICQR
jgi:HEPN domain-containing protein